MTAKDLRAIVAGLAGVDPSHVVAGFSLETAAFDSSIKKAALVASIRRHLGVDCMRAAVAKTFGELEELVRTSAAK